MKRRNVRAFTLVELLIVIGIIAILIGILIPVIGAVRKAAYVADTRNSVQLIGNAIDRYHTDYSAYPGVFSNAQITAGTTLAVKSGAAAVGNRLLTQSENLVLALLGGLEAGGTSVQLNDVGKGAITQGLTPKRTASYAEATAGAVSINGSALDPGAVFGNGEVVGQNTGVPEFIDRFPQAMPIIYLRARPGAAGSADASGSPNGSQYNPAHMAPYFNAYTGVSTSDFPASTAPVIAAGYERYFTNSSLSSTALVPHRKDTYMLISPGEDRKYGTSDDICNFSF